ncbi:MAG: DUF2807 domain-containing protein [Bacteroidales bacterium]|nr:DUF2807 domain-containing protein [Bacteroidales bacterium]MBN2758505.1 DUF2807 domain-containing protein [Bacteroidales bacterium]
MKNLAAYFIIILSFFLNSCENNCLSSSGEIVKIERQTADFKQIELYGVFNVYLKSGVENKIEIEAGKNIIPNIETVVKNDVLTINDLNKCDFIKGYANKNLYITFDTLTQLIVYDAANLYSIDTLVTPSLSIRFESQIGYCDLTINSKVFKLAIWFGSGDYILKGKSKKLYVYALYSSFIYAEEVLTEACYAYNKSMGDIYVKTDGLLDVNILDSGNIYYSGNPYNIEIKEHTGSGKLIKK